MFLEFENICIVKEFRNNVNCFVNCEIVNFEKIINVFMRYIENIEFIERIIGIDSFL